MAERRSLVEGVKPDSGDRPLGRKKQFVFAGKSKPGASRGHEPQHPTPEPAAGKEIELPDAKAQDPPSPGAAHHPDPRRLRGGPQAGLAGTAAQAA